MLKTQVANIRKAIIAAIAVIVFCVILALQFGQKETDHTNNTIQITIAIAEDSQVVRSYFIDVITNKCSQYPGYDSLSLGGGVDGFLLMKVFPGLTHSDFQNVTALMGEYSLIKGIMHFTGNAASNSAVINEQGFKTLLQNISARLDLYVINRAGVDTLINKITHPKIDF